MVDQQCHKLRSLILLWWELWGICNYIVAIGKEKLDYYIKSNFSTLLTACGLLLQPMNRVEVCNRACKERLFLGCITPLQLHVNFCICQERSEIADCLPLLIREWGKTSPPLCPLRSVLLCLEARRCHMMCMDSWWFASESLVVAGLTLAVNISTLLWEGYIGLWV